MPNQYRIYKYNFNITLEEQRTNLNLRELLNKEFLFTDEGANQFHKIPFEEMTLYSINSPEQSKVYHILSISENLNELIAFSEGDDFLKFIKENGVKVKAFNPIKEERIDRYKVVFTLNSTTRLELEHFAGGEATSSYLDLTEYTEGNKNRLASGDSSNYGNLIPENILKTSINLVWEEKTENGEVPDRARKIITKQKFKTFTGCFIFSVVAVALILFFLALWDFIS